MSAFDCKICGDAFPGFAVAEHMLYDPKTKRYEGPACERCQERLGPDETMKQLTEYQHG